MATEQDIKRVIGWMRRLGRFMQKEPPKDDRLTDYATMIVERSFTRVLDEAAIRTIAARHSFFPDPREMVEDLTEIRKNRDREKSRQDRYGVATERTPERIAWAKTVLTPRKPGQFAPRELDPDAVRVARSVLAPDEIADLSGATLADIQHSYAKAWAAITNDVLRSLSDDIDVAAATLQEGDRAHFRFLVTDEVRTLCSPLAQAVAHGRDRPPFPHGRIDLSALARRTESQLHSTAGYEGRKNITWWERREGKLVPPLPPMARVAPEMVWDNPNTLGGDRTADREARSTPQSGPQRASPPGRQLAPPSGFDNPNK